MKMQWYRGTIIGRWALLTVVVIGVSVQADAMGMIMGHGDMQGMMEGVMMVNPPTSDDETVVLPEPQSDGAQLLRHYCSQCHAVPAPTRHTATAWPKVFHRMEGHMRAKVGTGVERPSVTEGDKIIQYLQRHAAEVGN